ncbi:MAG: hypothetical protein AB7O24_19480 [Kofleriaceae bacterium]
MTTYQSKLFITLSAITLGAGLTGCAETTAEADTEVAEDLGGKADSPSQGPSCEAEKAVTCVSDDIWWLPGVRIEVHPEKWSYTLDEVAAGISIPYRVVVDQPINNVISGDHCIEPGQSGLRLQQRVIGSGQSYCDCDHGVCPTQDPDPVTLMPGVYEEAPLEWTGRNWGGPSDFGDPMGPPFPAGSYNVKITTFGKVTDVHGGIHEYELVASCPIELTQPTTAP